MTTRTVKHFVEFKRPFLLPSLGRPQPPGRYCVETDEELIASLVLCAYRRVATRFHMSPDRKCLALAKRF
jgi:hypothetical protein